ncbi:MAG: OmpA family protein [Rhodospirillales bacterium]|jgi:chemotaxis protein MotB|nr:OmpA family protein [Rhodospirillales bacterium]
MAIRVLKRGLLLASFVGPLLLSACVSQSDYDALQAQNQQLQQENQQLKQEVATAQQHVGRLQGAIKYTVNSDLLFAPGGWRMSARGKQIIARLAQKLAPTQQNKLLVNGYTDNTPIGPSLKRRGVTTNQELSQKRADSVMQYLIAQGVKPDLVSAHGYGASDPIASNDTAAGRAKNRRVELEIAPPA